MHNWNAGPTQCLAHLLVYWLSLSFWLWYLVYLYNTVIPFVGSPLKPTERSFGSLCPTNLSVNSKHGRKVQLCTSRRPFTVQAAYRYSLSLVCFLMLCGPCLCCVVSMLLIQIFWYELFSKSSCLGFVSSCRKFTSKLTLGVGWLFG